MRIRIMKRIIPVVFLISAWSSNVAWAEDLVTITADDIKLIEPEFTSFVGENMPSLMRRIETLATERELLHLKVDFAAFPQFWASVENYYSLTENLETDIQNYQKEALEMREEIFQQEDLESMAAIKLILDYKLLKKNIDYASRSIGALDRDLFLLFEVLKNKPVETQVDEVNDLRTYAAVMVGALYDLKNRQIDFDEFKRTDSSGFARIEGAEHADHFQNQLMQIGMEIAGKGQVLKATKGFFGSIVGIIGGIYNYELYVMVNKKVTIARYIKTILTIGILFAVWLLSRKLIYSRLGRGHHKGFAFEMLVKYGIFLAMGPIFLSGIGLDLANITLLASALSIGIGFGLTTLVSNFISGILILIEGAIEVGDKLQLEDGQVVEVELIGLRKCVLRTLDDINIIVPNTDLISKNVINLTLKENTVTRQRVPFSVNPAVDFQKMEQVAKRSVIRTLGGKEKVVHGDPFIRVSSLSTGEIGCELVVYMDYSSDFRPNSAFLTDLRKSFENNDIDIYLAPVTQIEMVEGGAKQEEAPPVEQIPKKKAPATRRGKK
jgi:small-conductance mechanosensitive channel